MKKRQIRLLGTSLMIGLMVMVSPIKAQNPNPDELAGKDVTKNYIVSNEKFGKLSYSQTHIKHLS